MHSYCDAYIKAIFERGEYIELNSFGGEGHDKPLISIKLITSLAMKIPSPVSIASSYHPMMIKIFSYYRSLIIREDCVEEIKQCAKRLKLKLSLYKIEQLYEEIMETENLKSLTKQLKQTT